MERKELLSKKKGYTLFAVLGFLCAFLWKAQRDLAVMGNILWTGKYVASILLFSALAGATLGLAICFLVYGILEHRWSNSAFCGWSKKLISKLPVPTFLRKFWNGKWKSWQVFLGSFVLLLLAWIPCYLAYYPGICSYDTIVQLEQITTDNYIDHHPVLHTLFLRWAMEFGGGVLGNVTAGVGLYVALQVLFVIAALAYAMMVLHHFKTSKWGLLILQLFGMFYPFHWYMSVTTTKDTIFSAFFLAQVVSLYGWLKSGSEERADKWKVSFVCLFELSTIGMMVFRNNGKFAMLVLFFFLVLAVLFGKKNRKAWASLLCYGAVGFAVGLLALSGLSKATNATQGDKREMLSMPIQQLARTMIYHGGIGVVPTDDNSLSQQEKALIDEFLLNESYRYYRPEISDPVKSNTNTYVVRYRAKEFVSTYLSLLLRYPGDYINAGLALTAGFLSPADVTHASINETEGLKGMGYIQTHWAESVLNEHGIYKASKWESLHEILEDWADENAYLNMPILKYLFVPGTVLWAYLLTMGVCILRRKYSYLMPLSLVLGYFGTLLLGPTVQLRYIYPLMLVLPFVWFLLGENKPKSETLEVKCAETDM